MIKYIRKNCTGCHICEVICSMEHFGKVDTKSALISYRDDWPQIGTVEFCRQCPKRSCMGACPEDALYLTSENLVALDKEKCIYCLACSDACPFGSLPTDGKNPLYCDTCSGLYQCVKWCPAKALKKVGEKNV